MVKSTITKTFGRGLYSNLLLLSQNVPFDCNFLVFMEGSEGVKTARDPVNLKSRWKVVIFIALIDEFRECSCEPD